MAEKNCLGVGDQMPVLLRPNDLIVTETELAQATITNLAPGAVTDIEIFWDASALTTGWHRP